MAKPEWGIKRLCPNCSARYYDMKKNPPVCPSCATPFDPEALLKSRRKVALAEDVKPKKAEVPEIEEVVEGVEVEGDAEVVVADDEIDDEEIEVEVEDDKEA